GLSGLWLKPRKDEQHQTVDDAAENQHEGDDENEVDVIAEQVDHRASLSKTRECSAPRTCCDWLGCEPVSLLPSLPRRTVAMWRCKNPTEVALIMSTRYATKSPTAIGNKKQVES